MLPIFQPRFTTPLINDENWIHQSKGGRNYCLLIKDDSVLPNCVGYAWGRWLELLHDYHKLSRGNAENWYIAQDGYERGQKPKLGAVACWRKGNIQDGSDGAGHVAIVEDILPNGAIVTSNSAYLGSKFYMRTIKAPYSLGGTYVFQGFIYLPIEFTSNSTLTRKAILEIAKEVIVGEWGIGADRKAKLTTAGYNYDIIQSAVNELISNKILVPPKTINDVAEEVIAGKWGNGFTRKNSLEKAGYDYYQVQNRVSQILLSNPKNRSITDLAKEVIAGKWGNGFTRKQNLINSGYDYAAIQREVNKLLKS